MATTAALLGPREQVQHLPNGLDVISGCLPNCALLGTPDGWDEQPDGGGGGCPKQLPAKCVHVHAPEITYPVQRIDDRVGTMRPVPAGGLVRGLAWWHEQAGPVLAVRPAISTSGNEEPELQLGSSAEHVTQRSTTFLAGPAVLATLKFADPPKVDIVSAQVTAGIQQVQRGVGGIGQFRP
ncbi:hypothetical protein GCM10009827_101270 [Dactylosporangium maewongense]|uniref:Uncharacterized protein n=1 Tax=Dactylosporangium maewongense TaxID=634393 RepID=A0ABP4NKX4_9ACTN